MLELPSSPSRRRPLDSNELGYHDEEDDSEEALNSSPDDEYMEQHVPAGDEEATGLISLISNYSEDEFYDEEDERECAGNRHMIISMGIVLVIATLAVIIPETGALWFLKSPQEIPVLYTCPSSDEYEKSYQTATSQIETNSTDFLKSYRDTNFDQWGVSYDTFKTAMTDFKSEFFPKYLMAGDTMFASACGNGLGVMMTLEIMQSTNYIENIIVYGSDNKPEAIGTFNAIMDSSLASAHADKGVICSSDDTDAEMKDIVPSKAFDLVYTGHISPLTDPLQFGSSNLTVLAEYYKSICAESDWKDTKLKQVAQQIQEEWYGNIVAELARVAKPGTPVIVEQVSKDYCNAQFDWGGVEKEWWTTAAKEDTYGWDINFESIEIRDDSMFREKYHVFMLKNGRKPE